MRNSLAKKLLAVALATLMGLGGLGMMASCTLSDKRSAEIRALEKAEDLAEKATSFDADITMTFKSGALTAEAKASFGCVDKEGNFRLSSTTEVTVKRNQRVLSTTRISEGYQNGYMYMGQDENILYAVVDEAAYRAWVEKSEDGNGNPLELISFDAEQVTEISGEKKDGDYEIRVTGLGKVTAQALADSMSLDSLCEDGVKVKNADAVIILGKDSRYRSVSLTFAFEGASEKTVLPEVSMSMEFRNWNAATVEDIDFAARGYTQVDDLMVLKAVNYRMRQMDRAYDGEFQVSITTETSQGSYTNTSSETDEIGFMHGEAGYVYTITADASGQKYAFYYENGEKITTHMDKLVNTEICTDAEARAFVKSLLDPYSFNEYDVVMASKTYSGRVIFKMGQGAINSVNQQMRAGGLNCQNTSVSVEVGTNSAGWVTSIKYNILTYAQVQSRTVTIRIVRTVHFRNLIMEEPETTTEATTQD